MYEDLISDLKKENEICRRKIKSAELAIDDKKKIDTILFIIIFALSIASIYGGVSVYSNYFQNISSILFQEVANILPFATIIYLSSKLVTSFIYGFNSSNKKTIKTNKGKVKKNNQVINEIERKNLLCIKKMAQMEVEQMEEIPETVYDEPCLNNSKVKKIGSIKR